MATHSSILAWEIPWTEEPGGLQPVGLQRMGHNRATEHTHTHRFFSFPEGGAIAQVFGFFGLSSLYLKSSTFHPLSLLRVDAQYPHGHCFCSGVTCALLLLFSLSSLQGVPGHWALKSHLPFLEPQAQPPQGVEGWGCLGCGPFCHVRFMGCTRVGKQQGTRFLEARFTSTAAPLSI